MVIWNDSGCSWNCFSRCYNIIGKMVLGGTCGNSNQSGELAGIGTNVVEF